MTFSHFMCHCKWYCTDHPAVTCHQSTAVTTDQTRVEGTITHTVDGLSCRPACRWWWAANRSSRDLWQIKIQLIIVSKLIATVMGPVWGNMILNISVQKQIVFAVMKNLVNHMWNNQILLVVIKVFRILMTSKQNVIYFRSSTTRKANWVWNVVHSENW